MLSRKLLGTTVVVLIGLAPAAAGRVQRNGEYLSAKEIEAVREFQEIEMRTSVFLYIADRRLKAVAGLKESAKEIEKWGASPAGTRQELLDGYQRAISELMDKIDDAYERNAKSPGLKKAIDLLHASTERHLKELAALKGSLTDPAELDALDSAMETAQLAHEPQIKSPAAPKKGRR